jgi:sugar O-acyltransferase (sialic acid O-acetyltransferase NeuD family)
MNPPINQTPRCVILGGGGHARVLIDCLRSRRQAENLAILDADSSRWGTSILNVPVLGGDDLLETMASQGCENFVVGTGSTASTHVRRVLFERGKAAGLQPLTVLHASAIVAMDVEVGAGSQVLAGAIINTGARVGLNVIVNTGAIVEHDCRIGDHVHIATGARLAGGVTVEPGAHIGAGSVIRQNQRIGEGAIVGAGAVVVADIAAGAVVAGVPARPIQRR